MANDQKEIRFIDSMYNEQFRIPDGGTIRVAYPDRSFTAKCRYIDDYHTWIGPNVFHICEFAELLERNGGTCKPEKVFSKEEQDRLSEAMEVAGMHFDEIDSSPDSLRFTSEMGIVTYFESWEEVENWIEGTVFDDPEVEMEVDEILHPEKYAEAKKNLDTYELYQLKSGPENHYLRFESYKRLQAEGLTVNRANYDKVYSGTLAAGETLDSIYERFNLYHPADFRGHSLSVSDVIVLHKDGQDQAFYVDSFGFKQVPEFFTDNPLKKVEELLEDDYGMIDGIINNGDRRKDEEEKKPSVREKLQEKKKEAAEAENNKPKLPKKERDQDLARD